ncbi:18662_t:CDS:1, partial [Racocetra persica]
TYVCENAGKYKPNKTKLIEQQHNKRSKKTDCKWHVNLSNPETSNFVHIMLVYLEHNHNISADNLRFATAFRKFDEFIMNEIEHAVVYGHCDVYIIRNLLQSLFPGQLFLMQDLSNAIQKIKRKKNVVGSDASYLLKFLLEQQKEDLM